MSAHFTIDFVHQENDRLVTEFNKKYKKAEERLEHKVEIAHIQETVRGLYVMEKWQREGRNGNPIAVLNHYSLLSEVLPKFVSQYLSEFLAGEDGEQPILPKTEKRKDKWATFDAWTKEHQAEQFTTEQLVETAGFSYPTVLKYVSESPLFGKVKKGLWEVLLVPKRDK
jgi:hypothetical protein